MSAFRAFDPATVFANSIEQAKAMLKPDQKKALELAEKINSGDFSDVGLNEE